MNTVENAIKDISSYAKAALARIKGDKDEETVRINEIKGRAAINRQISELTSKQVDAELALSDAKEAYENAIYTDYRIGDAKEYAAGIAHADSRMKDKQSELDQVNDSLEFFTKLLKERF